MIMQYGIRTDIDRKEIGQQLRAIDNPLASMFIAFTGMGVRCILFYFSPAWPGDYQYRLPVAGESLD
jgi:hypothetical protein